MPATEQTWRNQRLMHIIFAVSGVLLLISTIWMFVADHDRSWKPYQLKFAAVEIEVNNRRGLQYATEDAQKEHERLARELSAARSQAFDPETLQRFKAEVHSVDPDYSFTAIDDLVTELDALAETAAEKRVVVEEAEKNLEAARKAVADSVKALKKQQRDLAKKTEGVTAETVAAAEQAVTAAQEAVVAAREGLSDAEKDAIDAENKAAEKRQQILARLGNIVRAARFREDSELGVRKFTAADRDAAIAKLGLMDLAPQAEQEAQQRVVDELKQKFADLTLSYQAASSHRKKLQDLVKSLTATEDDALKAFDSHQATLASLKKTNVDLRSTYFTDSFPFLGKKWLELPILDAFNSPRKIDNLWSDDLEINYSSAFVRRFDRCTTCHQGMQKTMPGSAVDPAYIHNKAVDFVLVAPSKSQYEEAATDIVGEPRSAVELLELLY